MKHPSNLPMKLSVACGTAAYRQRVSQRRAKVAITNGGEVCHRLLFLFV